MSLATCATCGGPLTTANALGPDDWTHLHREDWEDDVHPPVPLPGESYPAT